jgi:hypothetical protein
LFADRTGPSAPFEDRARHGRKLSEPRELASLAGKIHRLREGLNHRRFAGAVVAGQQRDGSAQDERARPNDL